mgnify:CR=1 FL=1
MGHVVFVLLHLVAAFVFMAALVVTIPLHLIYSVVAGRSSARPTPATHVLCPSCKEPVHNEASICPHCRQTLVPQSIVFAQQRAERIAAGKRWWQS